VTIGRKVYTFGGMARTIFNHLRVFNTETKKWSLLSPEIELPEEKR